jgi:hypothetical protein
MRRRNSVPTSRVYLSLSENAAAVLSQLADVAILGKTPTEVATRIVTDWIWKNQNELALQGIPLRQPEGVPDDSSNS